MFAEGHLEERSICPFELDSAVDLVGKESHDLHSEGFGPAKVQIIGEADAVVPDEEKKLVPIRLAEFNPDFSLSSPGEGMFQGVGNQLVDDQPAGDGRIDVEKGRFEFELQAW